MLSVLKRKLNASVKSDDIAAFLLQFVVDSTYDREPLEECIACGYKTFRYIQTPTVSLQVGLISSDMLLKIKKLVIR